MMKEIWPFNDYRAIIMVAQNDKSLVAPSSENTIHHRDGYKYNINSYWRFLDMGFWVIRQIDYPDSNLDKIVLRLQIRNVK